MKNKILGGYYTKKDKKLIGTKACKEFELERSPTTSAWKGHTRKNLSEAMEESVDVK